VEALAGALATLEGALTASTAPAATEDAGARFATVAEGRGEACTSTREGGGGSLVAGAG
jgi:hypothetical protein